MAQISERKRAYNAEYYRRNREKILAKSAERNRGNREERRSWQAAYRRDNRAKILAREARSRAKRRDDILAARVFRVHGLRPDDWAALWEKQDGRCYLCGEDLNLCARVSVDHDHSHCAGGQSCKICQRGLTCNRCNVAIGMADDDPVRLRRMAEALEQAQAEVAERMAASPVQLELGA